ncbi:MAG: hypothetical protein IBX48_04700 [Thiomicrospira sp.]|uniref:YhdP family phospholipid transporter n=1 Tax=Thiomicrospira sp. TaxID=935 RepID=UPI0019DB8772|nr:DUF3971 domain-containing protein [Thiomicrospira sp.]MBE0493623.1 hypothetical protein [Thiomicrospira sp.]
MFFKSVRLFFEGLVLLFALYFVITRALITWVQLAPNQVANVTQSLSGIQIDFDRLKLEQTWTGFKLQVHNLHVDQPGMQLSMQSLAVDYHLLSPIWPSLPYGERLEIQQGLVQLSSLEPTSEPFEVEPFLSQISKFWRRANVTDLRIEFEPNAALQIRSLQVSRAERWNALSDIDLIYGDELKSASFQVRARLSEDLFGLLSSGDISLRQTKGLPFDVVSHFWPAFQPSIQRLPSGEFQFDASAVIQKRQLNKVSVNLNLDKLDWAQASDDLPRSASAQLNWDRSDVQSDFMQATLSNLRLDQISVADWSPVTLTKQNQRIRLRLAQASLIPFKPILHSIAGDYVDSLQAFELRDVDASFNLKHARLDSLNAKVDTFSWQNPNLSVGVQGLEVEHDQHQLQFRFADSIELVTDHTQQQNYRLDLGPGLVLDYKDNHQAWWLNEHTLLLNDFPIKLQANGDFKGFIDLHLKAEASTLEQVKASWLPFGLMPPKLEDWLKTALISGDQVEAEVWMKGQVSDFPFKSSEGHLKGLAHLKNARLAFNPSWPVLYDFDAQFEFTPFDLTISTPKAFIHGALAENVRVNIANLNQPNIAVEVSGQVKTQAQNGIDFLLASPLADKLGMRAFLDKQVKIDGEWLVELNQIWVPVKGFNDQDVKFAGKVGFDDARLVLFDRLNFNQLTGGFLFDEQGVNTQQAIQAKGLGADNIRLVIQTDHEHKRVALDIDGQSQLDDTYGLQGSLPFDVQVYVPYKADGPVPVELKFSADPAAVTSHWPSPFKTEQLNAQTWQTQIRVLDGQLNLESSLSNQLRMHSQIAFQANEAATLQFARFDIGAVDSPQRVDKGVHFNAALDEMDIDAWLTMLAVLKPLLKNQQSTDQSLAGIVWGPSRIKTQHLRFLNQEYDALDFSWHSDATTQQIKAEVQATYLQARIEYLKASGMDVSIEHAQIKLPDKQDQVADVEPKTCQTDDVTTLWPNVRVRANQLKLGDKMIDSLSFNLEDQSSVRVLSDIRFSFANQIGEGVANYYWRKSLNRSELALTLQSNRVAGLSEFIGFKKGFSGKEGSLKTKLTWSQGLTCFSLNSIEGDFDLAFNDGVIEQVEPGLARLIGLLSVDSFLRRLKLDLKDVTNEGMQYDRIRANGSIGGGEIDLKRFNVSSPGAQVAMTGQIILQEQLFNLDAQVTPAMGAALPTVAAILGLANPITGVLAYILAKNISFINEDIVTYNYKITGPWKQPEIKSKGGSVLFK